MFAQLLDLCSNRQPAFGKYPEPPLEQSVGAGAN